MLNRCRNPRASKWAYYGGRGIAVCERWLKFENFLSDMGVKASGNSLDRIDVNGDYGPENCKWSSFKEQRANQRFYRATIGDVALLEEAAAKLQSVQLLNLADRLRPSAGLRSKIFCIPA